MRFRLAGRDRSGEIDLIDAAMGNHARGLRVREEERLKKAARQFRRVKCRLKAIADEQRLRGMFQQHRIAGARVGEAVLAQAEPPPQLLADRGRQPLEHVGHKLRRRHAAQALQQVGRAFERQPGIQGENAANHLGRILDCRELIRGDRDEAGYH